MDNRIVWGCVNSNASVHSGAGFNVDYLGTWLYLIKYDVPFAQPPAVILTQNYLGWDNFGYGGGDTRDNAVLVAGDTEKFKVKTGGSDGAGADRNFSFVSIGM